MASIYDKSSLVLIPSGTKTGKVYSQKPVSGDGDFTFTRSGAATRVNADGFIEKETQNLFRYSEEFNQGSAWSKQGGAQISPNASTAPDGTNTADLLYPAITGVVKAAIQSFTSGNGTPYAQSIYVKASGKNFAALYALNGNAGPAMWVNLTTGEITNGSIPNAFGQFATSVGNGWWRIGFTDIGNGGISYMHIYPTDVAGSQNVTANGTDGILIWGAQLEYGLVARDYIKTTTTAVEGGITDNVPRLDYTDSSCPALMLEPQRTNLYTYSEYGGIWNKTLATITDNYAVSPEGVQNAFRANFSSNSGLIYVSGTGAIGGDNTLSVWAKSNTGTDQVFRFFANGNTLKSDNFTATTEWQRFTYTHNCTAVTAGITGNSAGGTSDILFYGFQQEAGSYATSYIPTYGSSVTRNADSAIKANIPSLIGQTEGTIFIEFEADEDIPQNMNLINFNNSTQASVLIAKRLTGQIRAQVFAAGVSALNINSVAVSGTTKVAFGYKSGDSVLYVNGVALSNSSTFTFNGTLTEVIFPAHQAYFNYGHKYSVNQSMIFKTRLTNEELATLTTI